MNVAERALRIGWMSHHVEGLAPLAALLDAGYPIACIITLEQDLLARKSGAADYQELARQASIPLRRIRNVNDPASLDLLAELDLDVLFVIGWSQILRKPALDLIRIGSFGAHASLLPANRGSAPINWALIKGEQRTGNTLMILSPEVDGGDIVAQRAVAITPFDNVATLYEKVGQTNSEMLLELAGQLVSREKILAEPQVQDETPLLARRRPGDGLIDWNQSAVAVYDFVRALTRPYPGAFSYIDGRRYLIWRAARLPLELPLAAAGSILGPVVSDSDDGCGLLVACKSGALTLLEIEDSDGRILSGRELAVQSFDANWSTGEQGLA